MNYFKQNVINLFDFLRIGLAICTLHRIRDLKTLEASKKQRLQ